MPFLDGGFGLALIFPLILLGLVVVGVVAVAGRRGEADPKGRRPLAIYLLAVMFVTLFVAFGAVAGVANTLVGAATGYGGGHMASGGGSFVRPEPVTAGYGVEGVATAGVSAEEIPTDLVPEPGGPITLTEVGTQDTGREVLEGLVVALVAGAVFVFHSRRLRELLAEEADDD